MSALAGAPERDPPWALAYRAPRWRAFRKSRSHSKSSAGSATSASVYIGSLMVQIQAHLGRPRKSERSSPLALFSCYEQILDLPCWHRLAEVITLHFVAVVRAQEGDLIVSLDTFGNDPQIELLP